MQRLSSLCYAYRLATSESKVPSLPQLQYPLHPLSTGDKLGATGGEQQRMTRYAGTVLYLNNIPHSMLQTCLCPLKHQELPRVLLYNERLFLPSICVVLLALRYNCLRLVKGVLYQLSRNRTHSSG